MKASVKTTMRLIKRHFVRLVVIIAIVLVSVGFMAGVGEVEGSICTATNGYYQQYNLSDVYLKSKRQSGFSSTELEQIAQYFGEENIETSFFYEGKDGDGVLRVYSYDLQDSKINRLELMDGRLPSAEDEVVVERETEGIEARQIGEKISVFGKEYTICGIVKNPLLIHNIEEMSFSDPDGYLSAVVYIDAATPVIVNDVHAVLEDRALFDAYSDGYEDKINAIKADLMQLLGEENVSVLSLYENAGVYSLVSYAEKVGLIGIVFVVFFLLVTMLVVYATMSRLFEEERAQIACQKTLGYSDMQSIGRYVLFVALGVLLGGLLALPVGYGLLRLLYFAFNSHYAMPAFPTGLRFNYYLVTFAIIFVCNTLLALFSGLKNVKGQPAVLLTPKAPKAGKKILIERIKFVWDRLSFKYKSTLRNVLLFKSRFLMTVISVMGSTVLVFAGMGLLDCALGKENAFAIVAIATVLLLFSAVLCALVVYNLTNINVSERKREIATLMVLGYHDKEVSGYIYREIYIMSFVGAILGIPFGILFMDFVFGLINFGSLAEINWWTFVLTPIVTMAFSFISTRLLKKKIVNTDMNESLKILE